MSEEFEEYSDFDEKVRILHKLASNYGWNYRDVFIDTPYPYIVQICALLNKLEEDDTQFINANERSYVSEIWSGFTDRKIRVLRVKINLI